MKLKEAQLKSYQKGIKMENLIEELTKVNPANLSEEGLKLFNKIMEIIDRKEELEKNNEKYKIQLTDNQYIKIIESVEADVNKKWKSKVREKIMEIERRLRHEYDLYEKAEEKSDEQHSIHRRINMLNFVEDELKELLQEGDKQL